MLSAHELAIGYPGHLVGSGFELSLRPGEALALLGPNGGGKTTLLKTLLGLLPARGGRVELDGRPLAGYSIAERARRLAYVPQHQGDSFAFTLVDSLYRTRALRDVQLLYYFKRRYAYDFTPEPGKRTLQHEKFDCGPVTAASLDWAQVLLTRKLVLLEINAIMLPSGGWGWLSDGG